jgi:hypothetical protein
MRLDLGQRLGRRRRQVRSTNHGFTHDLSNGPFASASLTTSLKSSLLSYEYENGRRYSGFGKEKYFLPADEV